MNNHKSFSNFTLAALALIGSVISAQSAVVFQTVTQSGTSDNWSGSIWGTPAAGPTAGNSYVTDSGFVVRTSNAGSGTTFGGDSLTLRGTGLLVVRRDSSADYIMEGGTITMAATKDIGGTMLVATGQSGTLNGNSRTLSLTANLSGSGTLYAGDGSGSIGTTTFANILNASNTFTGTWVVNGGTLMSTTAGALDMANFSVTGGLLDIGYSFASTSSALSLSGTGVFDLSNGFNHVFASVSIDGANLSAGTYSYADLNPSQQAFFVNGSDTFTVVPEPGSNALLAGSLVLLLCFRGVSHTKPRAN